VASPGQLLEALKRGCIGRLLAFPGDIQREVDADLRKRLAGEPTAGHLADDVTNLSILRNHATMYERRWQERLARGFEGWPRPAARSSADDAYALISEDELQSQLVGQPVIEALDRRFVDVLEVIDSRLWSFAAELGGQVRPTNPIGPRAIVDSFLETFPASECNAPLRQALLRQLERLAGERLGEVYAWFNTQLSDAGFAMARAGDFAMLMASPLAGLAAPTPNVSDARRELWSHDNALDARDSTWREGKRDRRRVARVQTLDAERGNALRRHVRALRSAGQPEALQASPTRELRNEEFLAVLSLLQGDAEGMDDAGKTASGLGARLREHLRQGAARLGMERASTQFSADQEDAIDLTGLLFDRVLATHALGADATGLLQRLCCPYLCLAMNEPYLFDDAGHAAHAWLSLLIEQWDANQGDAEPDAEAHALAEDSAEEVIASYHGDLSVFEHALEALRVALEPRRGRADIAERRTWQAIQGRERLQAARRDADAALAQRLQGRTLLASVAGFLDDQWRQSLVQTWLREGPESERYRAALAVGDAMVGIDQAAAQAQGHEVAEGLIALQQPLRDCYVACGLDENGANDLLAALVADLSQPDAQRGRHASTPLAEPVEPGESSAAADPSLSPLPVGQSLVGAEPGQAPVALRVAWVSPLSAQHLLVNRQGARQYLLSPAQLRAMLDDGRLLMRSPEGAIEGALQALAAIATASRKDEAPVD
jgi:hypothetical protein